MQGAITLEWTRMEVLKSKRKAIVDLEREEWNLNENLGQELVRVNSSSMILQTAFLSSLSLIPVPY